MRKIYIDLDGVLADFYQAFCTLYDKELPSHNKYLSREFIAEYLEIKSQNEVYEMLNAAGHDFWKYMKPFPWTSDIISILDSTSIPWYILTKGTYDSTSFSGKHAWVKEHLGTRGLSKLFIVTGNNCKSNLARYSDILIDDTISNINAWKTAGGIGHHWACYNSFHQLNTPTLIRGNLISALNTLGVSVN